MHMSNCTTRLYVQEQLNNEYIMMYRSSCTTSTYIIFVREQLYQDNYIFTGVAVQRVYIIYVREQLYNEFILFMYRRNCKTRMYYICTGATVQRVYIYLLYNKTKHLYIFMLPIAGQTAGPIGLNFFLDTNGWPGFLRLKNYIF